MQMLMDLIVWLWKKKVTIIISEILAFIIVFIYAFYIAKPQYSSSVTFFLPSGGNNNSLLGLASALAGANVNTGANIDPSQIEILFNTVNYNKNFIEYMGLQERYNLQKSKNPLIQTMKVLKKNLRFETEEKGSIATTEAISFKITYFDVNPDSAFIGINYLYSSLDSMIRELNVSRAMQEQTYFFDKINEASSKLDTLKTSFIAFQEENNLFAMQAQRDATIQVYSQLLANKISLMINYNEIIVKYGGRSDAAIEINNKISAIDKVVKTLPLDTNTILLKSLSDINYYKYLEYLKDIEFYSSIELFLTNQYEQTHLRVSNNLNSLQLVDKAIRPVYKSRPNRLFTLALAILIYNFALLSVFFTSYGYNSIKKKGHFDAFFKAL
jgi:uncharacterized protein involved in exopolysaccharide biosynthesis